MRAVDKDIKKVISLFKKYHPIYWQVQPYCEVDLKYIGKGSYRQVYQIDNLPIVVKLPLGLDADIKECISHSENEMDAINTVKKKHKHLIKYLPKIYYYNLDTGIIVMHKYKQTSTYSNRKTCKQAEKEITDAFKSDLDICKNFSVDGDKVILIDWGVLGSKSDWRQSGY